MRRIAPSAVIVLLFALLVPGVPARAVAPPVAQLVSGWTPPLSTRGRYVVDANGNRFRLKSGNWHGASGTGTSQSVGMAGRTVWFDRGDNRSGGGGDFANGNYKGQCADDEYVAGVAFTTRVGFSGTPDALYCRKLVG